MRPDHGLLVLACLGFLVFVFSPAQAARFSGDYLLQMCASDKDGREVVPGGHIACQAYIAGVMDYHTLLRSMGTAPSVDFCVPEGTSMGQLQLDVFRYIYRNRKMHGQFTATPGVALALYERYPCR